MGKETVGGGFNSTACSIHNQLRLSDHSLCCRLIHLIQETNTGNMVLLCLSPNSQSLSLLAFKSNYILDNIKKTNASLKLENDCLPQHRQKHQTPQQPHQEHEVPALPRE